MAGHWTGASGVKKNWHEKTSQMGEVAGSQGGKVARWQGCKEARWQGGQGGKEARYIAGHWTGEGGVRKEKTSQMAKNSTSW